MPVKTFLCDLGNVVLFFSHDRMCSQLGELCGRSADEIRKLLIDTEQHLVYERGEMTETEFHEWFQQATRTEIPLPKLRHAAADIFHENRSMYPLLERLRHRGIRLVLLSNTNASHIQFIRENFNVLDLFDEVVLSYEVGAVKPERAIFEAALRRIHCAPRECFYTDDIPEYVETGRSFGLLSEVYTDTDSLITQLRNYSLGLSE